MTLGGKEEKGIFKKVCRRHGYKTNYLLIDFVHTPPVHHLEHLPCRQ